MSGPLIDDDQRELIVATLVSDGPSAMAGLQILLAAVNEREKSEVRELMNLSAISDPNFALRYVEHQTRHDATVEFGAVIASILNKAAASI